MKVVLLEPLELKISTERLKILGRERGKGSKTLTHHTEKVVMQSLD